MQAIIERFAAIRLLALLLPLALLTGCGGSPRAPSDAAAPKEREPAESAVEAPPSDASHPADLLVQPKPEVGEYFSLHGMPHGKRPDAHAFDFQGGTLLLHVVVCRDYPNTPGATDFDPDAEEGAPLREVLSSFLLGPFPQGLHREPPPAYGPEAVDPQAPVEIEIGRKALLLLEADHVRLTLQQRIARKQGPRSGASRNTYWKAAPFSPPRELDGHIRQVRVSDYLAAAQHPLRASIPVTAGKSEGALQRDTRLAPGESASIHWVRSFAGVQTALIAECLPFGPEPDEEALRRKIAELEAAAAAAPDDRRAQHHLAWGAYLLAQQPSLTGDEKGEWIAKSVGVLRRLCDEEPANFLFRAALRDHLIWHLWHEAQHGPERAAPVVAELLRLRPVFEECLNAARFLVETPDFPADRKAEMASQLIRAGLAAGAGAEALTQANVRRFRQVLSADTLAGWGIGQADRDAIERMIEEFQHSSPRKEANE